MIKKIYFLSAFFPSFAGGAEKSILEEFKIYSKNGYDIKAISFDILYYQSEYDFRVVAGKNFLLKYKFLLSISRFAFLFFNRGLVKSILDQNLSSIKESEFVVLQGPYSPFIAAYCIKNNIKYHYYLRDNSSISMLFVNYSRGVRRLFKFARMIVEMPFTINFIISNKVALKHASRIIANSDKMADLLHKRIGLKADEIKYPKIDIASINNFVVDPKKQKYITFIGGRNSEKAYEIFIKVSKVLPEYEFLLVEDRSDRLVKGNLTFMPVQKDAAKIYEITKVAISISRWNNTFSGRVGLEAGRLKIPVISSSAVIDKDVDDREVHVLKNIDDVSEWVKAIRGFEKKRGIFILNSDFGVRNTIGSRAFEIYKNLSYRNGVFVFCRNFLKNIESTSLIKKVIPMGEILMKLINFFHIYFSVSRHFNLNKIKIEIFQFFLLKKLKKLDLSNIDFVHSWDFTPKVYAYIKQINPAIKIYQDVPMALTSFLGKILEGKDELYKNVNLKVDDYVKDCFNHVDQFIVPSLFVKDSLIYEEVDSNKISVVPFGVDINKFTPQQKHNKEINFCFAGAINQRKGVAYLIEAWKKNNFKNAKLNLYGRVYPEVRSYLENASQRNIAVYGFCDMAKELPKNNVYVFPSILEGSSKSVYEALASGLPVITTYNAGSVVEDGKQGFIIPVADAGILADKMKYFYENPEKIKEMGESARKLAQHFTWEKYAQNIISIYESN